MNSGKAVISLDGKAFRPKKAQRRPSLFWTWCVLGQSFLRDMLLSLVTLVEFSLHIVVWIQGSIRKSYRRCIVFPCFWVEFHCHGHSQAHDEITAISITLTFRFLRKDRLDHQFLLHKDFSISVQLRFKVVYGFITASIRKSRTSLNRSLRHSLAIAPVSNVDSCSFEKFVVLKPPQSQLTLIHTI